jgi:hypothetical protein
VLAVVHTAYILDKAVKNPQQAVSLLVWLSIKRVIVVMTAIFLASQHLTDLKDFLIFFFGLVIVMFASVFIVKKLNKF